VKDLDKSGIKAQAIHGNKSQNARQNALNNFKNGTTRVFTVATDIAARGIDVDNLSHVINYELPNIPETYVHRIGRTGRAGASGIAFSFVMQKKRILRDIHKLIGKIVPVIDEHPFPLQNHFVESKKAAPARTPRRRPEGAGNNQGNQSATRK
jgi:ATP-dependent RNA helicase RhlE